MGDSVNALEWLVGQVKGVSGDGDGPLGGLLSPGEVSDLANRAAASGIALSEDDAWDLAAGVVTEWGEPERPEFRALRTDQELNLMHVAVELADRSGLKDSVWLAMAAHDRRVYASARLAEDNLEELLKWLTVRPIPPSFMSSSVTVNPILTCFDAMIENVEDGRLERATLVAMCVAADLADLPPMSLLRGSAQRTAIADWVFRRAGDVSESRAASSTLRLYANLAACRSSLREAYQKIDSGQVAISHAYEWFQNRIRHLVGLHALASDQEEYLSNVANECCYLLYIHCAQVLVGQGNPSTALDYLSRADLLPLKRMHPSNVWLGREARAAAYSSLGDVYRALEQFSGSNQGALEGHTFWAAGRIRLETGDWVGGLNWLAGGYENARINGWGGADTRMGMLLSEKFIEIGAPRLVVSQLWNQKGKGGEVWIGRLGF